jgi:hypothetical protein
MSQIDKLRQIIREEVALAVRTEMKLAMKELTVLMENRAPASKQVATTNSLRESIKPVVKQQLMHTAPQSTGDPISDLLNETAMGMQSEDYRSIGNFGAQDAPNFAMASQGFAGQTQVVDDMSSILQAARPAGDVSGVQLPDAVPNFSHLMKHII